MSIEALRLTGLDVLRRHHKTDSAIQRCSLTYLASSKICIRPTLISVWNVSRSSISGELFIVKVVSDCCQNSNSHKFISISYELRVWQRNLLLAPEPAQTCLILSASISHRSCSQSSLRNVCLSLLTKGSTSDSKHLKKPRPNKIHRIP